MKKSTRIWLGIATIWPVVYIFLFMVVVFATIIFAGLNSGPHAPSDSSPSILFPIGFMAFFVLHMLTIMCSLAMMVFYIVRVFKTEKLDQNMKLMWVLLLFFMGMLAAPVFWYLYIWREAPEASNEPQLVGAGSQRPFAEAGTAREAEFFPPRQPPDWR